MRQKDLLSYSATELAELGERPQGERGALLPPPRLCGLQRLPATAAGPESPEQSPLYLMGTAPGPPPGFGGERAAICRGRPGGARATQDSRRLACLPEQLSAQRRWRPRSPNWPTRARVGGGLSQQPGCRSLLCTNALLSQVRRLGGVPARRQQAGKDAELVAEIDSKDVLLAVDFRRRAGAWTAW
ncbi:hypothetical protein ACTMU2_14580 [Cupriavidus basilensis]